MEKFCYFLETQEIGVFGMDLIGTLDVKEKARANDIRARGFEGVSSANLVQKNNFKNKNKFDGKGNLMSMDI
jgi:hypothetical protein